MQFVCLNVQPLVLLVEKVFAVLVCVSGIMLITFANSTASSEETVFGYVAVSVSCLAYSLYEVLVKRYITHTDDEHPILTATLYFGLFGVAVSLLLWPLLLIIHFTGAETFEFDVEEQRIFLYVYVHSFHLRVAFPAVSVGLPCSMKLLIKGVRVLAMCRLSKITAKHDPPFICNVLQI